MRSRPPAEYTKGDSVVYLGVPCIIDHAWWDGNFQVWRYMLTPDGGSPQAVPLNHSPHDIRRDT